MPLRFISGPSRLLAARTEMIVSNIGGDVTVASELGKGSVFTVRLPGNAAHRSSP